MKSKLCVLWVMVTLMAGCATAPKPLQPKGDWLPVNQKMEVKR